MNSSGWLQLALYVGALALITKPMGLYLMRVLDTNGKTWLDPVLRPLERLTYRVMGVRPEQEQDWQQYTWAMLLFSLVSCVFTYAILRLQNFCRSIRRALARCRPDLAFNTAVSFTTNTNWQSYSGESTMSYLSQMVALVIHNFASAATGIAIAAALVRGIARHSTQLLGNFWVDLVRVTYYLLLPICLVFRRRAGVAGHDSKFQALHQAKLLEPYTIQVQKTDDKGQPVTTNVAVMVQAPKLDEKGQPLMTNGVAVMMDVPQLDAKGQPVMTNVPVMVDQKVEDKAIVQGPMASQVAIKMLGTNGGGNTNANAAHPFENPDAAFQLSANAVHLRIGSGLTYYLGRMTKNQAHGWAVWGDDDDVCSSPACCSLVAPKPRAIRFTSSSASPPPTATWKARKSASAFSTPPCSPPSPPTPRAARSIPCTIRSRRSAGSCRCSTSSSAKSSSAAWARGFTACSCSSCWRCSSPG